MKIYNPCWFKKFQSMSDDELIDFVSDGEEGIEEMAHLFGQCQRFDHIERKESEIIFHDRGSNNKCTNVHIINSLRDSKWKDDLHTC